MNRADRRQQSRERKKAPDRIRVAAIPGPRASLLDSMLDSQEYASIVSVMPPQDSNLIDELKRAVAEIEAVRQRPCLMYVGNVINGKGDAGVISKDDLPFAEMVKSVPAGATKVDVFLATNGGSGPQIARFVNALRERFDEVDFLIPSFCMSAGTLFAVSGDRIWMTPQACLGPTDPQVPNSSGRFVPAQALLMLVDRLQKQGQDGLAAGTGVPWTAIRIIDTLDKKDLGDAMSATAYSLNLVMQFLMTYKFKNWSVRESSKLAVTEEYRRIRAVEVAEALASHERWKNHGHALSREVLWNEIKLLIDKPDAALERVMRRAWAVCYWLFDKTAIQKIMVAANYGYVMFEAQTGEPS